LNIERQEEFCLSERRLILEEILSKKNPEGYADPTAYKAVLAADHFDYRPVVYICSPYSGNKTENQKKARSYCRFAVDSGVIPLCPHLLLPQFMDEETERDLALFMDLVLMSKCKEVWVFGEKVTKGMRIEIARARKRGQKVRFLSEEKGR
jgi:hypothetical protein